MPSVDRPSLSLLTAFGRQFRRHGQALMASLTDVANPLLFFFMVVTLFPLGLGPDPQQLASMAPAGAIDASCCGSGPKPSGNNVTTMKKKSSGFATSVRLAINA